MIRPVIALIGRPNVGKSTLFNYLARERAALVADQPGVTRDRQYAEATFEQQPFIAIDTGGLEDLHNVLHAHISEQSWRAVLEAHIIFWMVDARAGLTATDRIIAEKLRKLKKNIYLVINKSDGLDEQSACADFYATGLSQLFPISAAQGRGTHALMQHVFSNLPTALEQSTQISSQTPGVKIAIIGRPNVGKSTLVNRILGEERLIVYDAPGTTRDSVYVPLERRGKQYTLIDTAGVRRRGRIDETLEKFSVVKTLQAITDSHVVVFVINAQEELADQDLHLLDYILDSGRALVIAVNKWDNLAKDKRTWIEKELDRRLAFVRYAQIHFISALHGSGVGSLFPAIDQAYRSATRQHSTHRLTQVLEQAVHDHQPPAISGRRIKLRYAHAGGYNPPVIVIHGNQTQSLPLSYRKYLENYFREALSLKGTPVKIELRSGENPYAHKKNELTARQIKRRQRLLKYVKK